MRRTALMGASGYRARNSEPQGSTLIFQDDFGTGNFNKWNSLQWKASGTVRNTQGSAYTANNEYPCTLVSIDGRTNVARFELRNGDEPFLGTERTEIGEPFPPAGVSTVEFGPGDQRWMAFDHKFDSTFPVGNGGWNVIWQWHPNNATGSPALCLDIDTDDIIYLANNGPTDYKRTAVQAVQRNVWQRWVIYAVGSDNTTTGRVTVWVDGVRLINNLGHATLLDGDSGTYHKIGNYRDPSNTATAISYYDNIKITAP